LCVGSLTVENPAVPRENRAIVLKKKLGGLVMPGIDDIITKALGDKASVELVTNLEVQLHELKKEFQEFRDKTEHFEKQEYTLKDLAKLMDLEPDTIRKNYISQKKIAGNKGDGSNKWVVPPEEYLRVEKIVRTRGVHAL